MQDIHCAMSERESILRWGKSYRSSNQNLNMQTPTTPTSKTTYSIHRNKQKTPWYETSFMHELFKMLHKISFSLLKFKLNLCLDLFPSPWYLLMYLQMLQNLKRRKHDTVLVLRILVEGYWTVPLFFSDRVPVIHHVENPVWHSKSKMFWESASGFLVLLLTICLSSTLI